MIYVAVIALVLALLFDFSVWMWLRANPVPPVLDLFPWRVERGPKPNWGPVSAATASSAFAVIGQTASYLKSWVG